MCELVQSGAEKMKQIMIATGVFPHPTYFCCFLFWKTWKLVNLLGSLQLHENLTVVVLTNDLCIIIFRIWQKAKFEILVYSD